MKKLRKYMIAIMLFALIFCMGCASLAEDGNAAYTVKFIDHNGDGVEGVALQACNDSSCMLYTSDEKGICRFELPAGEYELQILKLPEGYEADMEEIKLVSSDAAEAEFRLEKN